MLNTTNVLISKALIDSYNNRDEFLSVNDLLREYNEIKEEIKCCGINYIKTMGTYCVTCKENCA